MSKSKYYLSAIHREGYSVILVAAIAAFLLSMIHAGFGWFALVFVVLLCGFFRNPSRVVPIADNLVVSPADGVVTSISVTKLPEQIAVEGVEEVIKISIFLSVFDVHVNRVPCTGKVECVKYIAGKFINASLDKSSDMNERCYVLLRSKAGQVVAFSQIAGFIARRIVNNLSEQQDVIIGSSFGIIKFGSRMDVYLPSDSVVQVAEGQRMVAGETVLSDLQKQHSSTGDLAYEVKE
ncbi:phosphatidylserine decarboxylase family protein [Candidatus Sneabacter namystus]|uniref:Phosphatidylserine decarboxylase proenzyme n=1 Tax=Candidatus Sneabacter namystus TaxID=2601646 RepID=A0A5C0UIC8_9RICK|nr:phosphatidylserine decarboxylase family protein [Candidatus Sneabacter namystus]QEK39868.1 phosphatidylserine decarboxylase family protein [Candidatus Sneabacter namystus]